MKFKWTKTTEAGDPFPQYKLEGTDYAVAKSYDTYEPGEADPDVWACVKVSSDENLDWLRTMREARNMAEREATKEAA